MEYNNDFLNYKGKINRKNYIINMLILLALYSAVILVNFNSLKQFITYDFLFTVLMFVIELFKFVLMVAIISVIYRRIADFSEFNENMKKIFFIFFFFPFLYLNWGHYLLDFIPPLVYILDILTFFIILPVALVLTIVYAFLKGRKSY